jgi:hypothetical protein
VVDVEAIPSRAAGRAEEVLGVPATGSSTTFGVNSVKSAAPRSIVDIRRLLKVLRVSAVVVAPAGGSSTVIGAKSIDTRARLRFVETKVELPRAVAGLG